LILSFEAYPGCAQLWKMPAHRLHFIHITTPPTPGMENASAPQLAAIRRFGKPVTTKITPPFVTHVYTLVSFYLARRSGAGGMILFPRIVILRMGEDTRLQKVAD